MQPLAYDRYISKIIFTTIAVDAVHAGVAVGHYRICRSVEKRRAGSYGAMGARNVYRWACRRCTNLLAALAGRCLKCQDAGAGELVVMRFYP